MERFDITKEGQTVGWAEVEREGLYYRFTCRCRGNGIFHIQAERGGKGETLGIPVPEQGEFVLRKRLPVSRFPEGQFRFFIGEQEKGIFVPVVPGQPFAYLTRLQNARYAVRDGAAGVILSNIQDDANGTVV